MEEGCDMEQELYWQVFCATGDPMAYILFKNAAEGQKSGPTA